MPVIDSFNINGTGYDLRDAAAVLFDETQSLSSAQKIQARENIEASKGSAIAPDHRYIPFTLSAGSYALHDGELYRALVDIPTGEPWTQAHWEQTDVGYQLKSMTDRLSDLEYKPIEITALIFGTPTSGIAERGSTVTEVSLSWALSGNPVAQTLDGTTIAAAARAITLTGLSLTANKTYTLSTTDAGSPSHAPHTATQTATLRFYNAICYGAAALSVIDSAFVNALGSKTLSDTKGRTITVNAGNGQYIWYALPKRLGTCSFNVGGFDGGFEAPQTVSVTNSSGYTEDYYVYRSTNANLGNTTVKVI